MPTLPVYQVDPTVQERAEPEMVAKELFGRRDVTVESRGPQVDMRGPELHLDFDSGRGGIWAGDPTRLHPFEPVELPNRRALRQIGLDALRRSRLLPELSGQFRLGDAGLELNRRCRREGDGEREDFTTTATYSRDVELDVSDRDDIEGTRLPMFGGGGRFRATIGEGGQVVGALGSWREPYLVEEREVRDAAEVVREVQERSGEKVRVLGTSLGYYSSPAFTGQELLFPVYAVRSEVQLDDRVMPMRTTYVPATDMGSLDWRQPEVTPRAEKLQLKALPFDRRWFANGLQVPPGLALDLNKLKADHLDLQDLVLQPVIKWDPELLHTLLEARRPRSGGASWIGVYDWSTLNGSAGNAQGFIDELAALGWQTPFNWGNGDAWVSDWREDDDNWVDNVDFVFYTGHADMNTWVLSNGAGGITDIVFSQVGNTPSEMSDLWGRNNLEWVVIAACGPHQDNVISAGGGDVLGRWDGAFDGLHLMLGYGSVTSDNTEEGRRLVRYCRDGMSIRDAWFRAAQEIQSSPNGWAAPNGPTIWASSMSIGDAYGGTGNDHMWGTGTTYRDVRNATSIGCDWVVC